jgi:hypothetical protein
MYGVLPEELPEGYTWVKPYSWGDDDFEEPTRTQLDLEIDDEADADSLEPVGDLPQA